MDSDMNLALPKPQPAQAGRRKLTTTAVLALILLAGLTFWLTRAEGSRKEFIANAEEALQRAGLEPLVSAAKELFTPPPPPPPTHSVGLAAPGIAANGTLVQGTVPAAADLPAANSADAAGGQDAAAGTADPNAPAPELPPGVMPQQREDSVVRPAFVDDLANWLVTRYKPAPHGGKGQVNAGIQAANLRYGVNLRGMERPSKDLAAARAQILRYAFNPAMLEALYAIYAPRLVEEVARAALAPDQGTPLHETQLDDLYAGYAAFFADLAGAISGIAAMPDLKGRIEAVNKANQQTIFLHGQITENVFALDEAREKQDEAGIPGIEARIENLNERYRVSLQGQSNARAALVAAVRGKGPARRLDDDSLLFLALWLERRMDTQADALDSARTAANLLTDLSRRFEQAGSAPQKAAGTP